MTMLHSIAEKTVRYLEYHASPAEDKHELCVYGCETVFYTVISTAGLLFISILFDKAAEAALLITVFYVNQTAGGGFHAHNRLGCVSKMRNVQFQADFPSVQGEEPKVYWR